ncbi:hypothetical protein JW859_03670 [bacterium]|nr:hypothetical protein [bacterium]
MNEYPARTDLDFYRELKRLDPKSPEVIAALAFARTWADLARRVLAIRHAQAGADVEYPPALPLPALKTYLETGAEFTPNQFFKHVADWPAEERHLLADLAVWLAYAYDAANPIASSYQVWSGVPGDKHIRLVGPRRVQPLLPYLQLAEPPLASWLAANRDRPVAVIAHYDVHGLSMLALTLRWLARQGQTDVEAILSFELTGDISKLWKRTVPKAITSERGYSTIVMIDCSVHSRTPERTLKALQKLADRPDCRLVLVDHHDDTAKLAPEMLSGQLDLVLTDVLSCGLVAEPGRVERDLMVLGALGDKVAEVSRLYTVDSHAHLHQANTAYHQRMIHFSPTPRAMKQSGVQPLEPLWQALAGGAAIDPYLAREQLGPLPAGETPHVPDYLACGSILFVTERPPAVGRTWYATLEGLMAQTGLAYAAAVRILDGSRANMLLLTHWQSVHLPPIRYFVPAKFLARCLGHMAAVWIDVHSSEALELLKAVTDGLNAFLGTPADFSPVADALEQNVLCAG